VELNLLENQEVICPEEMVTLKCVVFSTNLLRWTVIDANSTTQISCFGNPLMCRGGSSGITTNITFVSSNSRDIVSTLAIRNVTTNISIECESELTRSRIDLQIASKL